MGDLILNNVFKFQINFKLQLGPEYVFNKLKLSTTIYNNLH